MLKDTKALKGDTKPDGQPNFFSYLVQLVLWNYEEGLLDKDNYFSELNAIVTQKKQPTEVLISLLAVRPEDLARCDYIASFIPVLADRAKAQPGGDSEQVSQINL